ncbi:MAG TPA: sensor histidine kinase [Symbiobacteriaceae bacterium]|nr:sensor histidine kinase [Symbiobacteriaceae bacterium]
MAHILKENMDVIRFVYGLIFFSLGFAIYLQPRRDSVYYLSTALSWLAAFALIHAIADWGLVFMPKHPSVYYKQAMALRSLGLIVSYGLLMQFGLTLLTERHPRRALFSLIPSLLTAIFVVMVLLAEFRGPTLEVMDVKILARYGFGFPAALLSAWGLLRQLPTLRANKFPHTAHLVGAAGCFVLYGIVGGLIVPPGRILLAGSLNEEVFLRTFGIPVEIARGLAMLGVTYFTVRLLDIFHLETQRRLRAAEQDRALLREREQIARELHDGVMQTLYGTGLGLKQLNTLSLTHPDQAQGILAELNKEIGRAIVQMRRFVLDLKEQTLSAAELAETVRDAAGEISQFAGLPVDLRTELTAWGENRIPSSIREEVLAVVREGLSNVVRHAQASSADIMLSLDDDAVLVRVSDDGTGFSPATVAPDARRGLDVLKERIEAMGGLMQIHSQPGEGTQLVVHLPVHARRARSQQGGVTS